VAIAVRTCSAKNKAGQPCKAAPLLDKDVCLAHADAETRESAGFVADNGKGGRPRLPGSIELARQRLEANADEWHGVLEDARRATKAVWVGGEDGSVVETPDHTTRLAAYREAHDRAYGKPTQRTEQQHTGSFDVAAFFGVDPLQPTDSLPEEAGA
jgi:hypothetical protein